MWCRPLAASFKCLTKISSLLVDRKKLDTMTQKKNYRINQVNRLLQEEIAALLLMEMQDDRLKQLTITEVRTSRDLRHAVVYATAGMQNNPESCIAAAKGSAGHIRKLLYSRLRLKQIPELEFRYDESLDRAVRIFEKLDEIQEDLQDSGDSNDSLK